jgi:hypothetical protein
MPAIFKLVITRPSLAQKFWFSDSLNPATSGFTISNNVSNMQSYINSVGPGFITSYYEEVITYEEIVSRENEISPDIKDVFFLPRETYPIPEEFSCDVIPGADPKLVPFIYWGCSCQPPFNPFTLTYTFIVEFDTIENLQNSYQRFWATGEFYQEVINSANLFENTVKFFINDVEVVPQ